jgi:hypothetical protein
LQERCARQAAEACPDNGDPVPAIQSAAPKPELRVPR